MLGKTLIPKMTNSKLSVDEEHVMWQYWCWLFVWSCTKSVFSNDQKNGTTQWVKMTYSWIGDGIGRRKKSSSWQNSCNSICWGQQWQSFSLIWNRSYRKVKSGIRREQHIHRHQLQTHILKETKKKSHRTAFLQIRLSKMVTLHIREEFP